MWHSFITKALTNDNKKIKKYLEQWDVYICKEESNAIILIPKYWHALADQKNEDLGIDLRNFKAISDALDLNYSKQQFLHKKDNILSAIKLLMLTKEHDTNGKKSMGISCRWSWGY